MSDKYGRNLAAGIARTLRYSGCVAIPVDIRGICTVRFTNTLEGVKASVHGTTPNAELSRWVEQMKIEVQRHIDLLDTKFPVLAEDEIENPLAHKSKRGRWRKALYN